MMALAAVALSSCSKLGNLGADNFKVTPTPTIPASATSWVEHTL